MHKREGIEPFLTMIQEAACQPKKLVRLVLNSVFKNWQVFVHSILCIDKLPEWDGMWVDLQQEELRQALLKSSNSGNNDSGLKTLKEEENVALASKGLI